MRVSKATVNLATVQSGGSQSTPTAFDVYPFELIKAYAYDGVGRLVAIRSPRATTVGEAPVAADENGTNVSLREERLYYDGVRRVQEVVRDLGLPGTAENTIDRALQTQWLEREYVWGPGDNGIDELLAQYQGAPPDTSVEEEATILAWQGKPWWALHDASGDVVAVCETPAPVSGNPVPTRVVQQYTYEPYGAVMVAETGEFFTSAVSAPFAEPPVLHVGHKGLFADRLDELITGTGAGSGDAGALEVSRLDRATATNPARLAYHTRNRVLSPDLGRWLQRDPNATGQTVLHAGGVHGAGAFPTLSEFHLGDHVGNGMNTSEYVGSAPSVLSDPSGMFFSAVGQAMMAGYNAYESATGTLAEAQSGLYTIFGLNEMLTDYMAMQDADADWALDWSQHDFDYFASGVEAEAWGYSYEEDDGTDDECECGDGSDGPVMAGMTKYHPNSRSSRRANHGYEIWYKKSPTDRWAKWKNGISSSKLTSTGRSKRAMVQEAKIRANHAGWQTKHMIVKTNMKGRQKALDWERKRSIRDGNANPNCNPGQDRPRPAPMSPVPPTP